MNTKKLSDLNSNNYLLAPCLNSNLPRISPRDIISSLQDFMKAFASLGGNPTTCSYYASVAHRAHMLLVTDTHSSSNTVSFLKKLNKLQCHFNMSQ